MMPMIQPGDFVLISFSAKPQNGDHSAIFIFVAFAGIIPARQLVLMALVQTFIKTAYEIVILPVTIVVVNRVKKLENENVFDNDISYNPFRLKEV